MASTAMSISPAPEHPPSTTTTSAPTIHTYHCICNHLVLATTTPLPSLSRRSASSTPDKAYILSLPKPIRSKTSTLQNDDNDPEDSDEDDLDGSSGGGGINSSNDPSHYAILLSCAPDRKPRVITRQDGFETRYMQRCGRCMLVFGYYLDWVQFPETNRNAATASKTVTGKEAEVEAEGTGRAGGKMMGRREDVVYLLPNGLVSTADMVERGDEGELELGFGN